ncbi:anaerobic ribonucleoside-triphosphate reductase [Hominenteromicrobium sp.]|uniref:anaerobic ribonucleoside-triphosphate reductase n=1 Tax=Hominenteromicrobium sp. TaxID=3073581 RepID=UPI00399B8E65
MPAEAASASSPGVTDKQLYHQQLPRPCNREDRCVRQAAVRVRSSRRLSTGGAISYVEVPNMQNNLEAVLQIIRYIYDNIMYAELNTKSDYCQKCGYDGEIQIVEDDGKLVWECPNCGNRDQDTMNVARRTCGYIGTQFWNQGRTAEIKERVLHL